jgi:2',3'-cyclic-nucleotide 2'-phosphodiesterase (5'-nucleotidase family)
MCLVCFILGLALTMLALTGPPALAKQAEIDLSILHVNDTHGHIIPYLDKSIDPERHVGGAEYLAKMVEQERAANPDGTILLSAGDMFQGTPISNLFHGKPVIEIMNFLHYDAMALGNHEFDWGQHVLQDIIHSASFPVVSANIYKGGGHIKGVKPYVILKRKGIRIAVIGLTTPETRYSTKAENVAGLTFENPEKILPSLIRQVKAQGASMVIVLSHDGLDSDRLLARKVRGIDVIVGGHSHTVIKDPVVESGTVIVQAGSNGVYLGVLHVSYNSKSKKIVDYTSKDELKLVSPSPGSQMDPNVAMIIDKYDTQVRAEFSKVIGTAAADFTKDRVRESSLGDLVADAMRESSGAEIAFQNAGGIRADIQKGPITLETLFTALPFDDDLVSMDLAGEKITELLEKTASLEKILQVSGMRIVYDMSDPSRVKLAAVEVAGNPIDPRKTYRVVTNDFLATSGGAFSVFKQGRNISFGQQQRDAVAGYIRQNSPISPNVQDRIIFKK